MNISNKDKRYPEFCKEIELEALCDFETMQQRVKEETCLTNEGQDLLTVELLKVVELKKIEKAMKLLNLNL